MASGTHSAANNRRAISLPFKHEAVLQALIRYVPDSKKIPHAVEQKEPLKVVDHRNN